MRELSLLYTHSESLGYGRMGVQLAAALRADGVDVYERHGEDAGEFPDRDQVAKTTNTVAWCSYPTHARGWYEGQHKVMLTMWETDRLPESFRENLGQFEKVIVPSEQNVELFSLYHDNVSKMLLGVDPVRWHYTPRRPPGQFFNFLIGGSGPRKGCDLAFSAFRDAFPAGSWGDGPIPRLIMKSPKAQDYYADRVEQVNGRIPNADEEALYADAHCYLQPSRGEGFGLQPLQALAMGIPTILTAEHGHASFAHLGYALASKLVPAGYFMLAGQGGAGNWWEPDRDELIGWMRYVYNHYDKAVDDMKVSAERVARDFTWANTAKAFCAVVGDEMSKPYTGSGEWEMPVIDHFLLITNRDYAAEIAGHHYQWTKGERYYEPADVKRILFESGVVDPACLGDDPGFTAGEVEKYSGIHSWCRECGQKLGSGESRSDTLLAAMA